MLDSIGKNIKRLRRARNFTQEELAELIGVTPQAVSKWESEAGLPDISQIPPLSAVFGVSADEILGINVEKNEKIIDEIINDSCKLSTAGEHEKSAAVLEKGLSKFPHSHKLMAQLAKIKNIMPGNSNEAVRLCKRVLDECGDKEICDNALCDLIFAYDTLGDHKRAIECAKKLPSVYYSREEHLMYLLNADAGNEREEAIENLRDYVEFCTDRLMLCLEKLSGIVSRYTTEERLKLLSQLVTIGETIFCDGDYDFDAQFIAIGYRRMAEIYAAAFDAEKTLASLEKESLLRICFDTYEKHKINIKTSPAVRGCPAAQYLHGNGSQTGDMIERMDDERYEFIRDDPRFKAISLKLRQLKLS